MLEVAANSDDVSSGHLRMFRHFINSVVLHIQAEHLEGDERGLVDKPASQHVAG